MSRSRLATIALGVAAALCAAGALVWWASADRLEFYTGAGVSNASAKDHSARDILWRSPESLTNELGGETDTFELSVPAGGPAANNELLFARVSADGDADLYSVERIGRVWSEPRPIAVLNTLHNEQSPRLSPEGAWLYFASDRPGGAGGLDLWRAPRTHGGWGEPENLGESINTSAHDAQPAISPASGALWFASDRERPIVESADETVTAQPIEAGFDLYRAARGADAELVAELSSAEDDVAPAFSPVGDFVYFASAREGGAGGMDLYRARVTGGEPGAVQSLGPPVNTEADEYDPAPASEGFELFYTSVTDTDAPGDVLRTVSREVDLARDTQYGDLSALLRLLPWILLVLALVLLLSMLRRLASGGAARASLGALSLMAKCVLVSLILHALLLALLSLWMVKPEEGQFAEADSGTRVSLASSSIRSSLEAQVRESAGAPVPVAAEDVPDRAAPTPVDAIAAAESAPAPLVERDEAPNARNVTQASASATTTSAAPSPTLSPEALPTDDLPLDTPTAQAARRVAEADTTIDAALDSPALMPAPDLSRTNREAVSSNTATPLPDARAGEQASIRRDTPNLATDAPQGDAPPAPARTQPDAAPAIALSTPAARAAQRAQEAQTRVDAPDLDAPALRTAPATPEALSLRTPTPESSTTGDTRRIVNSRPLAGVEAPRSQTDAPRISENAVQPFTLSTPGAEADEPASEDELEIRLALSAIEDRPTPDTPTRAINLPAPRADSSLADDAPRLTRPEPIAPGEAPTGARDALPEIASTNNLAALALPSPSAIDTEPSRTSEPSVEFTPDTLTQRRLDTPPPALALRTAPPPAPDAATEFRDERRRPTPIDAPDPGGARPAAPPPVALARAIELPVAIPVPVEPDALTGTVLDASNDAPIAGARVRLDLAEADDASASTDDRGAFTLRAFDIPDNSAISASAPGYIPYSANITADELEAGATAVIRLWPESMLTVALEDDPEVHHLGNDAFTGRVNSQFQRRAEGLTIEMPFTLAREQLPPNTTQATLLMLAKGVQLENRFYLNGRRLRETFPESPRDGSFGEVAIELPLRLLREGENVLGIESVRRGDTDYDDFEFVNARIRFIPAGLIVD